MKTEKAKVAKDPFGTFEIDGLMMPDGSFGVGVPQVTRPHAPLDIIITCFTARIAKKTLQTGNIKKA